MRPSRTEISLSGGVDQTGGLCLTQDGLKPLVDLSGLLAQGAAQLGQFGAGVVAQGAAVGVDQAVDFTLVGREVFDRIGQVAQQRVGVAAFLTLGTEKTGELGKLFEGLLQVDHLGGVEVGAFDADLTQVEVDVGAGGAGVVALEHQNVAHLGGLTQQAPKSGQVGGEGGGLYAFAGGLGVAQK